MQETGGIFEDSVCGRSGAEAGRKGHDLVFKIVHYQPSKDLPTNPTNHFRQSSFFGLDGRRFVNHFTQPPAAATLGDCLFRGYHWTISVSLFLYSGTPERFGVPECPSLRFFRVFFPRASGGSVSKT
jgi:hypothetical protein